MQEGIEITEADFKRYNVKEQNVVIFKNLLEVKRNIREYQETNVDEHRKIKGISWKALVISGGAIGLAVILLGFLFQHLSQTLNGG